MKNLLILILINSINFSLKSQNYLFPINNNSQNYLSGNLGELRGDHFHMGIDIKTFGKINLPVIASENGFIERLRVSGTGYGKAIYIKHEDGNKTVYAHLNKFNDKFEKYITDYQYRNKKFIVNLFPGNKFKVKKGDTIGYSGNSGTSGAPHLHYEYRDSNDLVYNPLSLNFKEIKDNRSPTIELISFKSMDLESRVNDQFGIFTHKIETKSINENINLEGNIGISIYAFDRLDGYLNKVGINQVKLYVNDSLIINNKINYLSYNETNYVSRYIDFHLYKKLRRQFIKLYQDDGNKLNFHRNKSDGIINFSKDKTFDIRIEVFDLFGNKKTLFFTVNNKSKENMVISELDLFEDDHYILDNTLVLRSHDKFDTINILYKDFNKKMINDFSNQKYNYYLVSLKEKLPLRAKINDKEINFNLIRSVSHNTISKVSNKDFNITFNKESLFDTLYLSFFKKNDSLEYFNFKNEMTFKKGILVELIPKKTYNKLKSHVYNTNGKKPRYIGGEWKDNKIKFYSKNLSNYTILEDNEPPKINILTINQNEIKIKIKDFQSGISNYEGKINDQWILFEYDKKNDIIISKKLNSNQSFKGRFVLTVEDNASNKTIYKINI
tara:strand:+ start:7343 stop:9175 length:1833 start_codon:yes stop_codon:yes gene_type:complete